MKPGEADISLYILSYLTIFGTHDVKFIGPLRPGFDWIWILIWARKGASQIDSPSNVHPGRLTAGRYKSPIKREENDLNQTSMIMFHVNHPGCIAAFSLWFSTFKLDLMRTFVYLQFFFSTDPAFWGELPNNSTHLTNHLPAASFEGFKENPSFVLGMSWGEEVSKRQ